MRGGCAGLVVAAMACLPALGCATGDRDTPGIPRTVDGSPPPAVDGAADGAEPPPGCGHAGRACCETSPACAGILLCVSGTCRECGRDGQPCCLGDACNSGHLCADGACMACGGAGQPCCPGTPCESGLSCLDGSCRGCGTEPGTCAPGTMETRDCGDCGVQIRLCDMTCSWGDWSDCSGEGECSAGATETRPCGSCGSQSRTCTSTCRWDVFSLCAGEGVCAPGSTHVAGCGECQARTCSDACTLPTQCLDCSCTQVTRCGSSCPSGYHPSQWLCMASCGARECGFGHNAVLCRPNCGTSYTACGSSCFGGYRRVAGTCSRACGDCGLFDNAVICAID